MNRFLTLALLITLVLLAACQRTEPTPVPTFTAEEATATATWTPAPLPPATSTTQPTPTTEAVQPSPTASPSVTPVPQVVVQVQSDAGEPIAGATVTLTNSATGYEATGETNTAGEAIFDDVEAATTAYDVEVTAAGYQPESTTVTISRPDMLISVTLTGGVLGRVTVLTNLRNGPGLTFDILAEIPEGELIPIFGVDETGEWYNVRGPNGLEGWVFAELIEVQGDLSAITGGTPTAGTPAPTTAGTPAPSATAQPAGTITATATITPTAGTTTATPTPVAELPTRPGTTVAFNAANLRANMDTLEFLLFQMGGLLDRLAGEGSGDCIEYLGYYAQVAGLPIYGDVPEEWISVHDEHQQIINNVLATNEPVAVYCLDGAVGELSQFNFNLARNGINEGISLLFAIQAAADALLGD